jgi:hypothetical protein
MSRGMVFSSLLWALLLLPSGLILLGQVIRLKSGQCAQSPENDPFGRTFARWLAAVSSGFPVIVFCVVSLPERINRQIGPSVPLALIVAGGLTAIVSAILCIAIARGPERVAGAAGSILAIVLLGGLLVAGLTAAA